MLLTVKWWVYQKTETEYIFFWNLSGVCILAVQLILFPPKIYQEILSKEVLSFMKLFLVDCVCSYVWYNRSDPNDCVYLCMYE